MLRLLTVQFPSLFSEREDDFESETTVNCEAWISSQLGTGAKVDGNFEVGPAVARTGLSRFRLGQSRMDGSATPGVEEGRQRRTPVRRRLLRRREDGGDGGGRARDESSRRRAVGDGENGGRNRGSGGVVLPPPDEGDNVGGGGHRSTRTQSQPQPTLPPRTTPPPPSSSPPPPPITAADGEPVPESTRITTVPIRIPIPGTFTPGDNTVTFAPIPSPSARSAVAGVSVSDVPFGDPVTPTPTVPTFTTRDLGAPVPEPTASPPGDGGTSTDPVPLLPPSDAANRLGAISGNINLGAILGGVIGGVAFILLLIGLFILRRVRRNRAKGASPAAFMTVADGSTPAVTAHPFHRITPDDASPRRVPLNPKPSRPHVDTEAVLSPINAEPPRRKSKVAARHSLLIENLAGRGTAENMAGGGAVVAAPKRARVSTTSEKSLNPTVISQTSWWAQ